MTVPRPTSRTYRVLGVEPGASVARSVAAYDRLDARYDPRRHPADQQGVWLDCQNAIDEALALIADAATSWGRGGA